MIGKKKCFTLNSSKLFVSLIQYPEGHILYRHPMNEKIITLYDHIHRYRIYNNMSLEWSDFSSNYKDEGKQNEEDDVRVVFKGWVRKSSVVSTRQGKDILGKENAFASSRKIKLD